MGPQDAAAFAREHAAHVNAPVPARRRHRFRRLAAQAKAAWAAWKATGLHETRGGSKG